MRPSTNIPLTIKVGARPSLLSQAQVREIYLELIAYHPHVLFETHFIPTVGDQDQKTSLRTLDKTNFFTKEIDEALLEGICRIGIHSAKDLPEKLAQGLALLCMTKGINSSDSLVLNPGITLASLITGATIATSSVRREEAIKELRSDLNFCDIRGTIEQRLSRLQEGVIDGVVIAEAALIRLGLTHLNRISLPGSTVEGQGKLAVVGKEDDIVMQELFACLHG